MAQSSQTPQEFIQNAFSPMVAVMSSPSVDAIVQKNNLNFVELLQPFCRISAEGHMKDPAGVQCTVKNLKLSICSVLTRPPQPTLARKFLNEAVSNASNDTTTNIQIGNYSLDIPSATPWFDAWRETFFNVQFPSEHEFTRHFVACMLVVSSAEHNPSEAMSRLAQQLAQMQGVAPPRLPKWFNASVLRCYVLLHDAAEGDADKAEKFYESIKHMYGAGNCFFLSINSRSPSEGDSAALPDPWSKFLIRRPDNSDTGSDRDSLPRTPGEMSAVSGMPSELSGSSDSPEPAEHAAEASEGLPVSVQVHPLSPDQEGAYDAAGCFGQSDALTTSIESDSGLLNPNVWEPNSVNGGVGVLHGGALTSQDVENVRNFVQDFALKALLPYFERQIIQLQDVVSNKKGVGRSLFSATKRWFGTNKPGTNMPVNSVIYTGDCPELQLRRLGDMWFLLGQWSAAFQAYHAAKREYSADGAWLCYAGALEMAALAAFLAGEASRKTLDYMEESITTYLTSCRMPQYAVRATLLSAQVLSARGLHGEAAKQLIRMTSEECDLRSALLLEQAARGFLAGPRLPRKHAFHMVLAGHRYSRAGQRRHSLRCYRQAYQVYRGGGWRLATDHIEFAVGRLAGQVKDWEAAAEALAALLAPRSLQPPAQQGAFLREYLHVHQQWTSHLSETGQQQGCIPVLPVPRLQCSQTAVLVSGLAPSRTPPGRRSASGTPLETPAPATGQRPWARLEEMLLTSARGAPPMIFKPSLSLFCSTTDNSSNPIVPQGEPVEVLIHLENPLKIDITVTDVQLLWQFKSQVPDGAQPAEAFSNESCVAGGREYDKSLVVTQRLGAVVLHSERDTSATLGLTPLHPGTLTLLGVAYRLCNPSVGAEEVTSSSSSVLGKQVFEIRGPKLKNAKDVPGEVQYGPDKRLEIIVVPPAPCLQVTFTEVSSQLLSGELQRVNVEFRNAGRVPLKALYMATSHPQHVCLASADADPFRALTESRYLPPPLVQDERQLRLDKEKRTRNRHCVKVLDSLGADQAHSAVLWLQAPRATGSHLLHALFYYESAHPGALPRHRLLRHSWTISVQDSVQVSTIAKRTLRPSTDKSEYEEGLNIAVEVKNSNQPHHSVLTLLEPQQLSLLSQNWRLEELVPLHRDVKILGCQETLHMIARARRCKKKQEDIISSDLKLDTDDNSKSASIREKPYSCFVTDYTSIFDSEPYDIKNETYMEPDSGCVNSTLVVRWKADITEHGGLTRVAIGQHHINIDSLNLKVSSLLGTDAFRNADTVPIKLFGSDAANGANGVTGKGAGRDAEERLVTFSLEHRLEVSHDFGKQHVCLVPVTVHLVNCSTKEVVAVINTSSPMSSVSKCPGIGWVGAGGVRVRLAALSSARAALQAASTRPGTYALGNILRISCRLQDEEDPVTQSHVTTSTLIVTKAG